MSKQNHVLRDQQPFHNDSSLNERFHSLPISDAEPTGPRSESSSPNIYGLGISGVEHLTAYASIPPPNFEGPLEALEAQGIRAERESSLCSATKEYKNDRTKAIRSALNTLTETQHSGQNVDVGPASQPRSRSLCSQNKQGNSLRWKPGTGMKLLDAASHSLRPIKSVKRAGNGHYCEDFSNASVKSAPQRSVPVVYARIFDTQRPRTRLQCQRPIAESSKGTTPRIWEEASAAADWRFELAQGERSGEAQIATRQWARFGKLPLSNPLTAKTPLTTGVNGKYDRLDDTPIPLDFFKQRGLRTPSVRSSSSDLVPSSPLLVKSIKAAVDKAYRKSFGQRLDAASLKKLENQQLTLDGRVKEWLRHVVPEDGALTVRSEFSLPFPRSRKGPSVWTGQGGVDRAEKGRGIIFQPDQEKRLDRALKGRGVIFEPEDVEKIWDRQSIDEVVMSGFGANTSAAQTLKDVTNVRRPGYLKYNSFARDFRKHTPNANPEGPSAIEDTPSPLRSMATPDSKAGVVLSPSLSRATVFNETMAKLEGRAMRSWETVFD